jgi:hypothetical protein
MAGPSEAKLVEKFQLMAEFGSDLPLRQGDAFRALIRPELPAPDRRRL